MQAFSCTFGRKAADQEGITMERIMTLTETTYQQTQEQGGCGECQTSCQSACKTSCTVGNQSCENQ